MSATSAVGCMPGIETSTSLGCPRSAAAETQPRPTWTWSPARRSCKASGTSASTIKCRCDSASSHSLTRVERDTPRETALRGRDWPGCVASQSRSSSCAPVVEARLTRRTSAAGRAVAGLWSDSRRRSSAYTEGSKGEHDACASSTVPPLEKRIKVPRSSGASFPSKASRSLCAGTSTDATTRSSSAVQSSTSKRAAERRSGTPRGRGASATMTASSPDDFNCVAVARQA
mmetsp:Transcript_14385/g.51162  ORF Transcript_14385/g.51162 Transcript_14385/m.51162 type:complete len:230 (-) Transcript_14385:164-853(-)